MGLADKMQAKVKNLAQDQIPEPVLAAAILSRKGKSSAMALGGLAGTALHSAPKRADGFGATNILAITEAGLWALSASNTFSLKVKGLIGSWPWNDLQASTTKDKLNQYLRLEWGGGTQVELESSYRGANKAQGEFIDDIVRRCNEPTDGRSLP